MEFGIMFFSSSCSNSSDRYALLKEAVQYADVHGFSRVWTPERHFHEFGGLFPNPALTSAAIAMITNQIQICAGSLIAPLHHTLRMAEDWAVIDNLSRGRAGISFGSGWNIDDFLFFPERYERRKETMYEQITAFRKLWRGEPIRLQNSAGKMIEARIFPKPIQADPSIWITSSGDPNTFVQAGQYNANILTHLIDQDIAALTGKIVLYQKARADSGFGPGKVTLMLHTFISETDEDARRQVGKPLRDYLRSAVALEQKGATGGGAISGGHILGPQVLSSKQVDEMVDLTFERYYERHGLLGTLAKCGKVVERLAAIGVDEIACLVDFGPNDDAVIRSLEKVNALKLRYASYTRAGIDAQQFSAPFSH